MVLLPAMWLEGCENNKIVNIKVKEYLLTLSKEFVNVNIIDMNNNFSHNFFKLKYYRDLEHLTFEGAQVVTKELAKRIRDKTKISGDLSHKDLEHRIYLKGVR